MFSQWQVVMQHTFWFHFCYPFTCFFLSIFGIPLSWTGDYSPACPGCQGEAIRGVFVLCQFYFGFSFIIKRLTFGVWVILGQTTYEPQGGSVPVQPLRTTLLVPRSSLTCYLLFGWVLPQQWIMLRCLCLELVFLI